MIGPGRATLGWCLSQLVAGSKLTGSPSDPSKVHIAVVVERVELLAQVGQASAVAGTATSLSEDSLTVVGTEPVSKGLEGLLVVGCTLCVGATAVGVQVLMDVEDEREGGAVHVLDLLQCFS